MPAPEGNRFWEARSTHGRKPLWEDPEELKDACYQYVTWAYDNPLEEAISYQGEVMKDPMPKMRAMTIMGLCIYLGIVQDTWQDYRKKDGFSLVTKEVDDIIKTQKFEGAAAGLLNPSIIARDLGLRDAIDKSVTGPGGGPIQVAVGPNELARRLAFVIAKGADDSEPE